MTAHPQTPELAPHYYRDNFLRLCDTVQSQYGDILLDAEQVRLDDFRGLPFDAQCLYVRLVSRTGPWFRESRLHYPELGPLGNAIDALLASDFAFEPAGLAVEELERLYTRQELRAMFPELPANAGSASKAALIESIAELGLDETTLRDAATGLDGQRILAPGDLELAELLQLLFFGNRYQGLTEFVLEDLGLTRYYPYRLEPGNRLFGCREAVAEYLACAALSDRHYELTETGKAAGLPDLGREVEALAIAHPSSEKRLHRLCNQVGRDLERLEAWDLALRLYERSARHPARERRARILERREDWAGARALSEQILQQPWCEAEAEAAQRILLRVQRKLDGQSRSRPRDRFSEICLALPAGEDAVEQLAAAALREQWSQVHYVENALLNALFGLAFWEQIFEPVPGAFHNPYQSVPADMYEPAFRANRADAIAARLEELRSGDLAATLLDACRRYTDYQCRWVNWRRIKADLVGATARCIPAGHLLAIFERILFDPGENRRGFPDLIALGETAGDYCLVEVKGPGDALHDGQKRWLRFFREQGIPAQVARVEWSDG